MENITYKQDSAHKERQSTRMIIGHMANSKQESTTPTNSCTLTWQRSCKVP